MTETVVIPARFNGPRESGNGGYCCGVFASHLDGPAEVSLRSPVPLGEELALDAGAGGSVRVTHGDTLVAEAKPASELDLEVPEDVGLDEARNAESRYRGLREGPFSSCFVCGLDREDSFGVFAGRVGARDVVASTWTPPTWAADGDGAVRPEIVWAVLDCPTFFAAYLEREPLPIGFLVRQQSRRVGPVKAGSEHVVVAWPIEEDGSKSLAGSAVLTPEGEPLAVARVLLVEPRASA